MAYISFDQISSYVTKDLTLKISKLVILVILPWAPALRYDIVA